MMLSAESAAGKHPVAAVRMMDRIITEVEADPYYRNAIDASRPDLEASIADVICHALHHAASVLPVKAIVTYTTSGSTSLRAARERPPVPVLALTPDVRIARRLCLVWGIYAVKIREADRVSEIVEHACETVRDEGLAGPGDIIAIAAGMPFGVAGTTNLLRIERLATA